MISNKVIEFCLGALAGAGLVLVVRVIIGVVGLIAMEVPR
jgi:hypothetical protein